MPMIAYHCAVASIIVALAAQLPLAAPGPAPAPTAISVEVDPAAPGTVVVSWSQQSDADIWLLQRCPTATGGDCTLLAVERSSERGAQAVRDRQGRPGWSYVVSEFRSGSGDALAAYGSYVLGRWEGYRVWLPALRQ